VGVPAANRRAQCLWEGDGTCVALTERVEATGLATARNLRPGSCVSGPPPGGLAGKELARQGKAIVKLSQTLRWRRPIMNPQGSTRPARAGTAPREGKALQGSSRDASGMEQGREASGATANGGVPKTPSEPRASQNRREGQEP